MSRSVFVLILMSSIAAAQVRAAEEPAKNAKGTSSLERSMEKAGAALGRTADRAEKSVRRGAARTADAIESAGKKTSQWLNEKTK